MTVTIGSNIASMRGLRRLDQTTKSLDQVFMRLASGQRINRASDDAVGLAISSSLKTDARLSNQAVRNINDAVSYLNIADSALSELTSLLTRQSELAQQAANGVYTLEQRKALNDEAEALTAEFNRIIATTDLNGQKIFDTSNDTLSVQVGINSAGSLELDLGKNLRRMVGNGEYTEASVIGTFNALESGLADFDGDGVLDLITLSSGSSELQYRKGNGDGTFQGAVDYLAASTSAMLEIADLNNDGLLDIITLGAADGGFAVNLGNGDGTFAARQNSINLGTGGGDVDVGDFNGDGNIDAIVSRNPAGRQLLLGNGDGTFDSAITVGDAQRGTMSIADFNNDGLDDFAGWSFGDNALEIYLSNGDGTFSTQANIAIAGMEGVVAGDVNFDGYSDIIAASSTTDQAYLYLNDGSGGFTLTDTFAVGDFDYNSATRPSDFTLVDINEDGHLDLAHTSGHSATGSLYVMFNDGEGNFGEVNTTVFATGRGGFVEFGDVDNDGVKDVVVSAHDESNKYVLLGESEENFNHRFLSLFTQEEAAESLDMLVEARRRVASERSSIGANLSRLDTSNAISGVMGVALSEAAARITDANIAAESAKLVRLSILREASASVLAQANQQPALVLRLLG